MTTPQVSLKILGNWNPHVFTPLWIKTKLLGLKEDSEIDAFVNFEEIDFGYKYKGLTIFPKFKTFEIALENCEDETLSLCSDVVVKILELLPQTPIKLLSAIFKYELEPEDNIPLLEYVMKYTEGYREFKISQISQALDRDYGRVSLFTSVSENKNFVFSFHFIHPQDKLHLIVNDFMKEHYDESQNHLK